MNAALHKKTFGYEFFFYIIVLTNIGSTINMK
jgi:hypothetical protein